ncbi:hypothetical protein BT63DRAFT_119334 [Microthyrium microscopicum]|uniref:Uncharacterized protein n=1 Tax=Microthyrium microscopicum TaxID=703497 RepID=A0A6A6TVH6_9PEZI|nr:hypothetical protein BT63DRAFT_119334 [Microthyrium microscopicum]
MLIYRNYLSTLLLSISTVFFCYILHLCFEFSLLHFSMSISATPHILMLVSSFSLS